MSTEAAMSIFAVNGVRIDPRTRRVTHVRWAQVDTRNNSWATEPYVALVIDVVDAITGGDEVYTVFLTRDGSVIGPRLRTVVYRDATEGIELHVDATRDPRTLGDLPQI